NTITIIIVHRSILFFFFSCYAAHRDLHSFPTRRSSDLARLKFLEESGSGEMLAPGFERTSTRRTEEGFDAEDFCDSSCASISPRSEEHTSELQSPCNLVCRLLLEKKKKKKTNTTFYAIT